MQYRNSTYADGNFDAYWFEKNLQGDIVAVYSSSGTKLVSYKYDAWGNITTTYHNGGGSTVAQYNPFRYRGYYYDSETGFYYLNSRYYDPKTCRFINADGVMSGADKSLHGKNLFAYCFNNPIMYTDGNGEFPWLIIIILVATTVIGAVAGAMSDTKLGSAFRENESGGSEDEELAFSDMVVNTIVGGLLGLTAGGAAVSLLGLGGSLVVGSAVTQISIFGATGAQTFAYGALAFNTTPILLAPFYGIDTELVEYPS